MKKLAITLCLSFTSAIIYCQEKVEQYCQVLIIQRLLTKKVSIDVDYGEKRKLLQNSILKDEMDNVKKFNTTVDALNYLGKLGWKLLLIAPSTTNTGMYEYTFKKDFDKADVEKMDQQSN